MFPALLWGDPHFFTVDGFIYTFNGIGEYTMTKTRNGSYVLQARTAQFDDASGTSYSASAFTAFAVREVGSPTVQVSVNDARNGRGVSRATHYSRRRVGLSRISRVTFGTSVPVPIYIFVSYKHWFGDLLLTNL
jgi:hypothetical protein